MNLKWLLKMNSILQRQGEIMKRMVFPLLLIACLFIASCGLPSSNDAEPQRYSFYTVPGEHSGFATMAEEIAEAVPDRLANARLSVIARPESHAAEMTKVAVESALQKRFPHIRLLDRRNLDAVLSEQGRSLHDYANVRTAPELQRVELAQAILFIDIQQVYVFRELSSLVFTASVVDVETAVIVWQSSPETLVNMWIGYPIGFLLLVKVLIAPFYIGYRRAKRKAREVVLTDYNYTQLHPRLLAARERQRTAQSELHKRQYKDEAREIFNLGEQLDHLIDRAKILDTAIARDGKTNSKALLNSLEKSAGSIDKMETLFADISKNIRQNNLKRFDDTINTLHGLTDELLSDFTHLEQMK
jgi:hypothetical protein